MIFVITKQQYEMLRAKVMDYYTQAGIVVTKDEEANIEVADFGLGDPDHCALQLVIYVNTERVCAKEMVLLPGQTCPEHRHPPFGEYAGKEETFRCRFGTVYLYIEGIPTANIKAKVPNTGKQYYTVFHEIVLNPGDQYTIPVNTRHWFQSGDQGAVVSEFSTPSFDDRDVFTDPNVRRAPKIAKEA